MIDRAEEIAELLNTLETSYYVEDCGQCAQAAEAIRAALARVKVLEDALRSID